MDLKHIYSLDEQLDQVVFGRGTSSWVQALSASSAKGWPSGGIWAGSELIWSLKYETRNYDWTLTSSPGPRRRRCARRSCAPGNAIVRLPIFSSPPLTITNIKQDGSHQSLQSAPEGGSPARSEPRHQWPLDSYSWLWVGNLIAKPKQWVGVQWTPDHIAFFKHRWNYLRLCEEIVQWAILDESVLP